MFMVICSLILLALSIYSFFIKRKELKIFMLFGVNITLISCLSNVVFSIIRRWEKMSKGKRGKAGRHTARFFKCVECNYIQTAYKSSNHLTSIGHIKTMYCPFCKKVVDFEQQQYI